MPWWIWLLLALFMLGMIVAGIAYALLHGYHAIQRIAGIGGRLGQSISSMSEVQAESSPEEPPLFTQSLAIAQERYADAHAEIIRRKQAKRSRHAAVWSRWSHFNN